MIFKRKPKGFVPQFEAVACFIEDKNSNVLFLLRARNKKFGALKWASPAGKIEQKETKEQAVARELQEETGLKPEESRFVYVCHVYVIFESGVKFVFHMFRLKYNCQPGVVLNAENEGLVWLKPDQALASLLLMEDEAACVKLAFGLNKKKGR
jgi:8-oxo-dGTP diphosphatase